MNDDLNSRLARNRYIAILRGVAPDEVDGIATALLDEGIDIIEVPLNSPQPLESIRRLAKHCPTATWIGAGTVLDSASVRAVALAGARFVVAPNADSGVVSAAKRNGLVAIPGVFTPSEALRMLAAGADALKLFPAEAA